MFFSAALFALPLLAQSVLAKDCARKYTIKEGDICDSISAAQNVSTYQLSAINSGVIDESCSNLVPGNEICIGYTGEDCSTTYTIIADDTCEQIITNHRINSTILYHNNPQINTDCSNIYIGEVLCVSGTGQVPAAPSGDFVPGANIPVTAKPAKPTPTQPVPVTSAPATTPGKTNTVPTPVVGGNDDDDDDDIPFCDEL